MLSSRKIERFKPLPNLEEWELSRVWYEQGEFTCNEDDSTAKSFIAFLGVNKPEFFDERAKNVARIRRMKELLGIDTLCQLFYEYPEQTEFPSALSAELDLEFEQLLTRQ